MKRSLAKLTKMADKLRVEKAEVEEANLRIQQRAKDTREKFVLDIAEVLSESRNTDSLRSKIKTLQRKVHLVEGLENELRDARKTIKELERADRARDGQVEEEPEAPLEPRKQTTFLVHAEDKLLLLMFSFLETKDVIYSAQVGIIAGSLHYVNINVFQVNRYVFKRVDSLFGIDSPTARPEWANEPNSSRADQDTSPAAGGAVAASASEGVKSAGGAAGLTKAMAEALSKKLTGMTFIRLSAFSLLIVASQPRSLKP